MFVLRRSGSRGATMAGALFLMASFTVPALSQQGDAMGSVLTGTIEGPVIITDESQYPTSFQEAPMLAALVASGDLPPLSERLPDPSDVLVIQPLHEIGQYGGTMRRGFTGPGDGQNGHRIAGGDRLLFWDANEFPKQVPNLAKSWEVSEDGKVITINLRRGVKWSDGVPFTTADIMFWFEHFYQNAELIPARSPFLDIDAGATVEAPDDYTLVVSFPFANSIFLEVLASSMNVFGGPAMFGHQGYGGYTPAHYIRQFHPDFVPADELAALVAKEGFDSWVNLIRDKNTWARNPDLPVLTPWKTVEPITGTTWVLERNPYYYGVDTAGNQLPYIDRISMGQVENLEVLNLRAIAGAYDFQARHVALANIPTLLENQERNGYKVYLDPAQHGADGALMWNLSYSADAELAKWISNVDFRRALSLGIDRDAINEILFLGLGVPGSAVVAETSPMNPGPEYRQLWSTHDVATANSMLDAIGLTARDSEGYRIRTDNGQRLIIELTAPVGYLQHGALAELVKEHWAEIGIFANANEQEQGLLIQRRGSNDLPIFMWQNDGADELFLFPNNVLPVAITSGVGPAFGHWYASKGTAGVEPPAYVKRVQDLYQTATTATREERMEIGREIWRIITDEVWTMGTVGQSGASMGVRVVSTNMGNIPSRHFNVQAGQTPNISRPATFYFKNIEE